MQAKPRSAKPTTEQMFHIGGCQAALPLPMELVFSFLFPMTLIIPFTQSAALWPVLAWTGWSSGYQHVIVEPWPYWNVELLQVMG